MGTKRGERKTGGKSPEGISPTLTARARTRCHSRLAPHYVLLEITAYSTYATYRLFNLCCFVSMQIALINKHKTKIKDNGEPELNKSRLLQD